MKSVDATKEEAFDKLRTCLIKSQVKHTFNEAGTRISIVDGEGNVMSHVDVTENNALSYEYSTNGTLKCYNYDELDYLCLLYTSPSPRDRG